MSKAAIAGIILTLMVLGLLPFALVARSRASQNENLPPHLVFDMAKQPKFIPQRGTPMFADKRAMRPLIEGTLAREDMMIHGEILNDPANPHVISLGGGTETIQIMDPTAEAAILHGRVRPAGMTDEQFDSLKPFEKDADIASDKVYYIQRIPAQFPVNAEMLSRGQERFNIYCAPCHGESGYGDGMVAQRAHDLALQAPDNINGWTTPQNLNEAKIMSRPDGSIFNTISNGARTMPPYDKQISVPDRWAIIAYVRALEHSQNAELKDLSPEDQAKLPTLTAPATTTR